MKIELSKTPSNQVEAGEKPYFIRVYDHSAVFYEAFLYGAEIPGAIDKCCAEYLDSHLNMDK